MRGTFQLPRFSVVVWVRKTDNYPAIRDELLELAADDPYESTEYEGMVDFHWGFDRASQADELANSSREVVQRPEIVVLRIISDDDANPSRTLEGRAAFAALNGACPHEPNQLRRIARARHDLTAAAAGARVSMKVTTRRSLRRVWRVISWPLLSHLAFALATGLASGIAAAHYPDVISAPYAAILGTLVLYPVMLGIWWQLHHFGGRR